MGVGVPPTGLPTRESNHKLLDNFLPLIYSAPMPYIPTLQIFRWLWVAWRENDWHQRSVPRLGFTEEQAKSRCFAALDD